VEEDESECFFPASGVILGPNNRLFTPINPLMEMDDGTYKLDEVYEEIESKPHLL
jgi:hypothetical protein